MKGRALITISAGDAPDLAEQGMGREHVKEALVRLARLILRTKKHGNVTSRYDLGFGGDLRTGGSTLLLMNVVRAENARTDDGGGNRRSDELRRFVSFLAWPRYGELTPDLQARYFGTCRFVCVAPPGEREVGNPSPVASAQTRLRSALALSVMRRAMAFGDLPDVDGKKIPKTTARIVLGGRKSGYSGLMPGIPEEVAWAFRRGEDGEPLALYVLPCFGGAAQLLAKGILEQRLPKEIGPERNAEEPAVKELLATLRKSVSAKLVEKAGGLHPDSQYAALERMCAAGPAGLAMHNGLTEEQNRVLLQTTDFTEALRLIRKGMLALKLA